MIEHDGVFYLTWKEAIDSGWATGAGSPRWWVRLLAPVQHWVACTFLGHTPVEVNKDFNKRCVPGTGAPSIPGKVPVSEFMFEHPTDDEVRAARLPR